MISNHTRIHVAGHRGMVGSAIVRQLQARGCTQVITRTHAELDLTDQAAVRAFYAAEKPEVVILAAARVGGIHANNTYPAEFLFENLAIAARGERITMVSSWGSTETAPMATSAAGLTSPALIQRGQ